MRHIREHCKTPKTFMRRIGTVWACDCGQLWALTQGYKYEARKWKRLPMGMRGQQQ